MTAARSSARRRLNGVRGFARASLMLTAVACQHVTGLDTVTFKPLQASPAASSGAGGDTSTGGGGGGGGGGASACGACDGHCVGTHCCRAGGSLEVWSFRGGKDTGTVRFVQFDGKDNLEAAFANTGGSDIWVHDLTSTGPVESPRFAVKVPPNFRGSFAFGDLDKDGHLDLATNHYIGKAALIHDIALHRGRKGGFDAPVLYPTTRCPSGLGLYDFDGDGDLDLRFVYNPGAEPATAAIRYNLGNLELGATTLIANGRAAAGHYGAVRGAFPLGGDASILVGEKGVLEVPTGVTQVQSLDLDLGGIKPLAGGSADLDGDGDDDIVIVSAAAGVKPNRVLSYLRSGKATLELCEEFPLPFPTDDLNEFAAGDYDGDGHADLIAVDPHNEIYTPSQAEYFDSKYYVLHGTFP